MTTDGRSELCPPGVETALEAARRELVGRDLQGLLARSLKWSVLSSWAAALGLVAGVVALPTAVVGAMFFLPALVLTWTRFSALVVLFVLATMLLVYGLARARRCLESWLWGRAVGRYNEEQKNRMAALSGGDEPTSELDLFLRQQAACLVRIGFVAEYVPPGTGPGQTRISLLRSIAARHRLMGLSLWAAGTDQARCIASLVTRAPAEAGILGVAFFLQPNWLAAVPFQDQLQALAADLPLPVEEIHKIYSLPRDAG